LIVVEGPDGSGKTTLIQTLKEFTGFPVAPRVVSKEAQAMTDLKEWTENNVDRGFQATLFDRHRLFSEPIYGPILRDKFEPGFDDPAWFAYYMAKFYQCRPIVIYCMPPLETVLHNLQGDEENSAVQFAAREVYGAYYNKSITEYVLRDFTFLYDYTSSDAADSLDMIQININTRLEMETARVRPT
jgi:hypothetical protein